MKKTKQFLGMLLLACTLVPVTFVSCGDDEKQIVLPEINRTGTYKVKNTVSAGFPLGTLTQSVKLEREADGDYTMTIDAYEMPVNAPNVPYTQIASAPMVIHNLKAQSNAAGTTALSGEIKEKVAMAMQFRGKPATEPKDFDIHEGRVNVIVNQAGKLTGTVSFKPGAMPFPVVYTLMAAE